VPAERTAFRGDHLAHSRGARLELFVVDGDALRSLGAGDAPTEVAALTVAAHAPWVVGRDPGHLQVWQWTPERGAHTLARRTGTRDHAIGSLVEIGGETFAGLSQNGRLRLLRADGTEASTLASDRPLPWATHAFVPLAGERVAMLGNVHGEPCDMLVVLPARDLLAGPDAIQRALVAANAARAGSSPHDCAISLVVGPGPGDTMVVLRDPEDEEAADPDDDPDDLPDTWGLRGVYLRDLTTGALVQRASWDLPFHKLTSITATPRVIAAETSDGVAIRDRATGAVEHVARAALDPLGARLAIPERGTWRLRALPR